MKGCRTEGRLRFLRTTSGNNVAAGSRSDSRCGSLFLFFIAQYRDFSLEILAQSETRPHRKYNLAMKNKSLSCTMLHRNIVTHAKHGGSQPRKEEGALHSARRGRNAEAFLNILSAYESGLVISP